MKLIVLIAVTGILLFVGWLLLRRSQKITANSIASSRHGNTIAPQYSSSPSDFLEQYSGETTDELIAKADRYRIDSIALAFEQAIDQKPEKSISREESYILAIEGLEREVNNGGYHQYFINSSVQWVPVIIDALNAIGCPKTAAITTRAIAILEIAGELVPESVKATAHERYEEISGKLGDCDSDYFNYEEPIADRLFDWIKRNRDKIRIGSSQK